MRLKSPHFVILLRTFISGKRTMDRRTATVLLAAEVLGAKDPFEWLGMPHEELKGKKPLGVLDAPAAAITMQRLLWKMRDKIKR
jgi:hypothetical protein